MYFTVRCNLFKLASFVPKLWKPTITPTVSKAMAEEKKNYRLGSRLIWVDCEMTGLDCNINKICEIACVITEADLTVVDELLPIVIAMSKEDLENMSNWCRKTFKKNGLLEKINESKVSTQDAEEQVLTFLEKHTEKFSCALAGSSVNMDRVFIQREMPKVGDHFHYRTVDVSSFKEVIRRWYPQHFEIQPKKKLDHRALEDIYESIDELRWYREHFFKKPNELSLMISEKDGTAADNNPPNKKSRSSDIS